MLDSPLTMADAVRLAGRETRTSAWIDITQGRIDTFAACTGDAQWIHVDVERAQRESPFGSTIAHGYLTLSLIAPMVTETRLVPGDARSALNYGLDKVRFIAPVKAGARVRGRLTVRSAEPQDGGRVLLKVECIVDIEHEPKPALAADLLVLLVP